MSRSTPDGEWIVAADGLPQAGQEIDAKIMYMGNVSEVRGTVMPDRKSVLFNFWNGTGGGEILQWKPVS